MAARPSLFVAAWCVRCVQTLSRCITLEAFKADVCVCVCVEVEGAEDVVERLHFSDLIEEQLSNSSFLALYICINTCITYIRKCLLMVLELS